MGRHDVNPFDDPWLRKGFADLTSEIDRLQERIARHRGNFRETINEFNALVKHCTAMWVFVTASRGSKVEEIRNGSVLIDDSLMFVDDKSVDDERGARLIPSNFASKWALDRYIEALMLVSRRIVRDRNRHAHDVWSELAQGQLRFDAVCFQIIREQNGKLGRAPVTAPDVQEISRQYFNANKNFMRHVVITRWTIERLDPVLLRCLTGHGWEGAQVPAACSTYSPMSLVLAVREPLESLLRKWIDLSESRPIPRPTLLDLPLRRMHKCHARYRHVVQEGRNGPGFSRWHLPALHFCRNLREQLLKHTGISPESQTYLSLILFDGLHEQSDVHAIMSSRRSFEKGPNGWFIKWRRPGDQAHRLIPAQVVTGAFLELMHEGEDWLSIQEIETQACKFIQEIFPAAERKPSASVSAIDVCRTACALWLDINLPTGLQTAYSEEVHAPVLSPQSSLRLVSGVDHVTPTMNGPGALTTETHSNRCLQSLLKLVHHLGDTTQKLGEEKARSRYYEKHIRSTGQLSEGSLSAVLDQAIRANIRLQEAGASGRIKFSSVSTYLSTLTPVFKQLADESFLDLDGEGLFRVGQMFFREATRGSLSDEQRSHHHSAATWLLKTLRQLGYPFPADLQLQGRSTDDPATKAQSIPLIESHAIEAIRQIIKSRGHSQLDTDRLLLALDLLTSTPLRWMELATINTSHIATDLPCIRIESSGFSHIKTASSVRTIPVEDRLMEQLRDVVVRVERVRTRIKHPLVFGYLDPSSDDTSISSWIHDELSLLITHVLCDDFRIHNLRANVVTRKLFPGWTELFKRWQSCQATGHELSDFFSWSSQVSWRAESVSAMAGHSHPRSSVFYYLFASHQLRCLGMAAINSQLHPTTHLLKTLGISMDAHTKACQRDNTFSGNRWNHLATRLRGSKTKSAPDEPETKVDETNLTPTDQPFCIAQVTRLVSDRYICLRASGLSSLEATDVCSISLSQRQPIDQKYSALDQKVLALLRKREGKSAGERSQKAEIELIRSSLFEDLHRIFMAADPLAREHLLHLLRPEMSAAVPDYSVIQKAAAIFEGTHLGIEVIFGKRHVDPEVNARLDRLKTVSVGKAVRDLGQRPRAFVIRTDVALSQVFKSRLRSVTSILLYVLCNETQKDAPLN